MNRIRVAICFLMSAMCANAETRQYFIAADDVIWNMAPSGQNLITGTELGLTQHERVWAKASATRIGPEHKKARYQEYTDATFTTLKPRPKEWQHLGLLGPLIRAEVGDTIEILFRNNTSFPASMHPHGVFYEKSSEGAIYEDGTSGKDKADDAVPPGGEHTYVWEASERAGPNPGKSSIMWMYHSHTDEAKDLNTGLMGPMLINASGMSGPGGKPKDVDREFVIAFWEIDESASWYVHENISTYTGNPDAVTVGEGPFGTESIIVNGIPDFIANLKETLNGYIYGNLPILEMTQGENVRWYLMSGTNFEIHAPHWHGNVVDWRGMNADVVMLGTMDMGIADMVPDNSGMWLFHCHIAGHFAAGMIGRYQVKPAR